MIKGTRAEKPRRTGFERKWRPCLKRYNGKAGVDSTGGSSPDRGCDDGPGHPSSAAERHLRETGDWRLESGEAKGQRRIAWWASEEAPCRVSSVRVQRMSKGRAQRNLVVSKERGVDSVKPAI
jgi:hypothetical protein